MRGRCERPAHHRYRFYGGRGITVCEEWGDFTSFQTWAEANGWQQHLELDRKDPDGPYSPDNCRWIEKRANIVRARLGLGRLGVEDDLELRVRERAATENLLMSEVVTRALEAYLSTPVGTSPP